MMKALPPLMVGRRDTMLIGHCAMGYHFGSWRVQSFGRMGALAAAAPSPPYWLLLPKAEALLQPSQRRVRSNKRTEKS